MKLKSKKVYLFCLIFILIFSLSTLAFASNQSPNTDVADSIEILNILHYNGYSNEDISKTEEFGGCYIDEKGNPVILVTNDDYKNIKDLLKSKDYKVKKVNNSNNQLLKIYKELTSIMPDLYEQGITISKVELNTVENRVDLYIPVMYIELEKYYDSQFINIVISDNEFVATSTSITNGTEVKTSQYYNSQWYTGYSTFSFGAVKNGQRGVVVAGHAAQSVGDRVYYNNNLIGTVESTSLTTTNVNSDASFVPITNSNYDASDDLSTRSIDYVGGPFYVGMPVTTFGKNTGVKSTTIAGTMSSVPFITYPGNYYHVYTNLYTLNYLAVEGDSGGPVMYNNNLLGTIVGKGSSVTYYDNVSNIISDLNLDYVITN